jgi:hypothetical protein
MSGPAFRPSGVVTLLTDFGSRDPFVGLMKGVALAIAPAARLVDLGHECDAYDVGAAAFWLGRGHGYFPPGTVHLAVVDPGVGSPRRAVAAVAGGHAFVGPDNGLLAEALAAAGRVDGAVELDAARAGRGGAPSATFHGRDVFAPAAARLAAGAALADLGDPLDPATLAPSPVPAPRPEGGALAGQVVVVDRFGNLITNLPVDEGARSGARVRWAGGELPLRRTYADAAPGAPLALVNSFGVVEIAVRDGHAASALGAGRGTMVSLFTKG